jgi:Nif-specific regulatory protein
VQELSVLFAISKTLQEGFDLNDIARPVLQRLRDLIGLERGTITIRNRDQNRILLDEAVGLPRSASPSEYLKLIHPVIERVLQVGEPVVQTDLRNFAREQEQGPARDALLDALALADDVALICVPLKFQDSVIGTLSIERRQNVRIGLEQDLRLLTMVSTLIAQAAAMRQEAAEKIMSLREENERLQEQIAVGFRPANMIGTSSSMRTVYYHIDQVSQSRTTVLIRGESGTGKELVAKAIHEGSARTKKPFVKFNCAALPDSIIESELFGHERGAFTGALAMRKGRFEVAHGGTIFLDEIGDISPTVQVKLLRVLQEREFERVGGHEPIRVDVRIIAATSRNLEAMMADGSFREDLYYRLNVFPIYVPPIRERKCDLLLLADHFIEKYGETGSQSPTRISSAAIDLLMSYHWPGNVRELENCIERAVLLAKGQSIKAHHLPPTLQKKSLAESHDNPTLEDAIEALEREMIVDALKDTGSNMAEAARRLGLTERKMGLRVKKYDIDLARFRGQSEA